MNGIILTTDYISWVGHWWLGFQDTWPSYIIAHWGWLEDPQRDSRHSGGASSTHYLLSFQTDTEASQPFTEVTLQMSQSKIPTIPFVLPLYHKMEQHLIATSASWDKSFKIQHAAEKGLEKLRKYSIPAKLHHSYIIGTSKSLPCCIDPTIECTLSF